MATNNKPKSFTKNEVFDDETTPGDVHEDKKDMNVLVLDSLQSWVICFANFVIFLIAAGFGRAISMLFLDLVKQFDSTITFTSFSYTLHTIGMSLTSILVTSLLVPATGERVAVFIGAVLGGFSVLLMGVSDSIWIFFILMTLKGIGSGISLIVAISLISKYFDRRRSLATSLANCGVSVGNIVAPPLVTFLIENYDLRGIFLILGAIELHTIAAAMLLRPLSRYKRVVHPKYKEASDESTASSKAEEKQPGDKNRSGEQTNNRVFHTLRQISQKDRENQWNNADGIRIETPDSPVEQKRKRFAETKFNRQNSMDDKNIISTRNIRHTSISEEDDSKMIDPTANETTNPNVVNNAEDCSYVEDSLLDQSSSLVESGAHFNQPRLQPDTRHSFKSSSWSIVSTPLSDFTFDTAVIKSQTEVNAAASTTSLNKDSLVLEPQKKSLCYRVKEVFMTAFNVRLLRSWALRCLLLSAVTAMPGVYPGAYLPVMATKRGLNADEVSIMLMTGGCIDLASRIAVGWFSDTHLLKPTQTVAISSIILGTLCHFTYFATSFETLMAYTVVLGMFGGTRQSLGTLLTIQFMGSDMFLRALGFQSMFGIMSLAIHHPLLNTIMEATGSWNPPLIYCGVALYISATLLLLEPVSKRLDVKFKVQLT